PRVTARVLDAIAGFIRELTKVHLPGMAGQPQHIDVSSGAKDPLSAAGNHHASDFRVLEADTLQRVVQFDVYAEIVRVQLQLVAGLNASVFLNVHRQRGDSPDKAH